MIDRDICKTAIVASVIVEQDRLTNEFIPPEDMTPAMQVENWEERNEDGEIGDSKQNANWGSSPNWQRSFDCEPYDDQLRAYVITDPADTEILSVQVITE